MKYRCYEIVWNTGEDRDIFLPGELEVKIDPVDVQDGMAVGLAETEVVEDLLLDELHELVGWPACYGFNYEALDV